MSSWPGQRIAEAVIIGAMTALGSSYVTVRVLEERTSVLNEDIKTVRNTVSALDTREQRHYESTQESLRQIYSLLAGRRSGS
jgi:hypothetical protein